MTTSWKVLLNLGCLLWPQVLHILHSAAKADAPGSSTCQGLFQGQGSGVEETQWQDGDRH